MSEQLKSMDSGSSPTDIPPSQSLDQHLAELQNLLRRNQNEFTDRQRVTQERAGIEERWITDEINKCNEVHETLDKITREDRDANVPTGNQNTGLR
jgi:hypothetical protein